MKKYVLLALLALSIAPASFAGDHEAAKEKAKEAVAAGEVTKEEVKAAVAEKKEEAKDAAAEAAPAAQQ